MKTYYLDNAATTPLHDEVVSVMSEVMKNIYGNPSSTHSLGRESKSIIENARKLISKELNCLSNEIIFTSGGTEANNLILRSAVKNLGVKRIITQSIEHKCILETVLELSKEYLVVVEMLPVDENGSISFDDLEFKLKNSELKTMVSLMHGNNEIGNLLDIENVSRICKENNTLFHSDTVQTIGKYKFDLKRLPIDFLTCSAHKIHGPKGVGFVFIRKGLSVKPILTGGKQERNLRSGTENIYGIAGLAKAFELAYLNLYENKLYILDIKKYAINQLKENFPNCIFTGRSNSLDDSVFTVLNVGLKDMSDMIAFELDLKGIAISQGSACESGSVQKSHVIQSILSEKDQIEYTNLRISFSIYNSKEDIDKLIESLKI